jgi:hypothetical protein
MLLFTVALAYSANDVNVSVDGKLVAFDSISGAPFIDENNRTQVPFRKTLEAFGAAVDWDAGSRTAIAEKDGVVVKVPISEDFIYRNDVKITNDTKSLIRDGRTYLPIRAVLEAFGADVSYDASSRTVVINSGSETSEAARLISEVSANMGKLKSFDAEVTVGIKASQRISFHDVLEQDIKWTAKINTFLDPVKSKAVIDRAANGKKFTYENYLLQEDNNLVFYQNRNNEGFTKEFEGAASNYIALTNNPALLSVLKNFEISGRETVNGVSAIKLEGVIPAEFLDEIPYDDANLNMFTSAGVNVPATSKRTKSPAAIWIDQNTKLILKIRIDFEEHYAYEFYIGRIVIFDILETVTMSAAYLEMTLSNFDKATDFSIPPNLQK